MADAEEVRKVPLDVVLQKPGIPVGVQQALFCREDRAPAVYVDRATFENDSRHKKTDAEPLTHEVRHVSIFQERGILSSPRIEPPLDDGDLSKIAIDHEGRPIISEPNVRIVPDVKVYAPRIHTGFLKEVA